MKRILLCVQLETQFNELIRVARLLRDTRSYTVLFCFYDITPLRFTRMKAICADEEFDFILFDQEEKDLLNHDSAIDPLTAGIGNSYSMSVRSRLRNVFPYLDLLAYFWGQLKNFVLRLKVGIRQKDKARNLILNHNPSAIVVGEDGLGGPSAVISVAVSNNIPVAVVPYEYSTTTQPAEGIVSFPNYQRYYGMETFLNRMIARKFPQWVYEYRGERLFRETVSCILAQELLGISPYYPWAVHGGRANYVVVESKVMFQHYLDHGIPAKKLRLSGALYDDVLYEYIHQGNDPRFNRFASGSKKLAGKRKILCAIPPDHVIGRPTCDFKTYWDLLDYWVDILKSIKNAVVLFQLHPRVTKEQGEYITSKGVDIVKDDIAFLIPQCDILVTSVSSIIRIAIASKKIVVNYDVYKFSYQDYANAGGVITFQEKNEFPQILNKLMTDQSFYDDVVAEQSDIAENWGFLDGNAGKRMLSFFEEITA